MRKIKDKTKQIAYFLTTQAGVPKVIKKKRFSIKKEKHLTFKKMLFPIKYTKPAFEIGRKQFYLFDTSGIGQVLLKEIEEAYKKKELDKENKGPYLIPTGELYLGSIFEDLSEAYTVLGQIATEHTIKDLLIASELKKNWGDIIMGAIMGGLGTGLTMLVLITQEVF